MRLRSIELEQVGSFARPVRIGPILPGLNVLAGANELGKSTVLRGLTALFTENHRTAKQTVRDLRPYGGGAPAIACTFDLGGHGWRLEKRYLAAHRASLRRLDGREQYQGADAENRLAELMGSTAGSATGLPLLWVEQGLDHASVPVPGDGTRHALGQLLAAQAESTAGLGRAQAALEAVEAELSQLVTLKTGKARKNSSYHNLIAEHAEVSAALAEAAAKAEAARQRIARLTELQRVAAELSDRDVSAGLHAEIMEREARVKAVHEAERQLKQLGERVAFLDNQKTQRVATLAGHDEGLCELEAIARAITAADGELTAVAARIADIDRQLGETNAAVAAGAGREQDLRARLAERRRAGETADRRQRLVQLEREAGRLGVIAGELAAIDRALAELTWPEDAIVTVREAAQRLDQVRARQEAGQPRLRFSYEPGRDSGFRIGDRSCTGTFYIILSVLFSDGRRRRNLGSTCSMPVTDRCVCLIHC